METNEIINNDVIEETAEVATKVCNGMDVKWIGVGAGAVAIVAGGVIAFNKFVKPKLVDLKANHDNKKRFKCNPVEEVVEDEVSVG